jgi:hypothetical protein
MTLNQFFKTVDNNAYPWTEFINLSDTTIDLGNFYISQDSTLRIKYQLPSMLINPGEVVNIWYSGLPYEGQADAIIDPSLSILMLVDTADRVLDKVDLSFMEADQSYGRREKYPDQWIYFVEEAFVSPGLPNPDPGPWYKMRTHAAFPRGDAGYVGTVVYHDKMWLLDYETLDSAEVWHNLTGVWSSNGGINWNLINAVTPYKHGSMMVVFDDYMWAIDGRAFRSKDGITWEKMSDETPESERVAVFNNELWILDGGDLSVARWDHMATGDLEAPMGISRVAGVYRTRRKIIYVWRQRRL